MPEHFDCAALLVSSMCLIVLDISYCVCFVTDDHINLFIFVFYNFLYKKIWNLSFAVLLGDKEKQYQRHINQIPWVKEKLPPDQETMKKAKEDVLKGLSLRKTVKKYRIHYRVINKHVKNPNLKKYGGQTALSKEVEEIVVDRLVICANWSYPMDSYDLRLIIKSY